MLLGAEGGGHFLGNVHPSAALVIQNRCFLDGPTPIFTWESDGALRTALSMRNIGESPSEDAASTLSAILQASVPDKYYLSPKACLGILRRASARGKELPEILRLAFE